MAPTKDAAAESLLPKEEGKDSSHVVRFVTLQIFVKGEGPRYTVKHPLVGWDVDRLNLGEILLRHKLKALYAFSLSGARGLQLVPNPRNGLSFTTYAGREGSIVRLDADPVVPFLEAARPWIGAGLLAVAIAAGFMAHQGHDFFVPEDWAVSLSNLNKYPSWPVVSGGVGLFLVVFWKRLTMWYK